jgi:4'-phosphopantetheinyl transferase
VPLRDVHVWFQATGALDEAAIAAAASVLSDEERAQYHRFRFAHDARDYAAAHALLRATLSRDGDRAPERWRFDKTANGKPFLIDQGACRASFSLSHTNGMVACAVTADADVGVDVEYVDRVVDMPAIAARFFAPAEAAHLARLNAAAQRDRFFDLWTLKEALVKALGSKMAPSMRAFAFSVGANGDVQLDAPDMDTNSWQFGLFAPGPRHRLAVAARRSGPPAQLIFQSIAREP